MNFAFRFTSLRFPTLAPAYTNPLLIQCLCKSVGRLADQQEPKVLEFGPFVSSIPSRRTLKLCSLHKPSSSKA
jgi:hypothetical protein